METLHLEVTQLCALRPMQHQRNSGGNNVELTSQAVVVAHAGRRQEKTHTGTHCGMHAQFFNKKGTNGQACTTSRICTHIIIIAAAASVNWTFQPTSNTPYFTPFDTHFMPFSRDDTQSPAFCVSLYLHVKCLYCFRVR